MLTKIVLYRAIASGQSIRVTDCDQVAFDLAVTSYDRRIVRGAYLDQGQWRSCAFHRTDLKLGDEYYGQQVLVA